MLFRSYDLLTPELHIRYIDRMGVPSDLQQQYRASYDRLREVERQLSSLQMDEAQKARQIDLLTYQIGELEAADLKPGEQEELAERRTMYRNSEKIASAIDQAKEALDGEEVSGGALSAVAAAANALEEAERYLPALHPLSERVRNVEYEDVYKRQRSFRSKFLR